MNAFGNYIARTVGNSTPLIGQHGVVSGKFTTDLRSILSPGSIILSQGSINGGVAA